MKWGEAQVGDIVRDTHNQRWEVIEVVQHGHLRAVDPDDASAHRFIRAINWPEYRDWTKETRAMATVVERFHEQQRERARTWAEERVDEGRESLAAYVAKRRAKGDTVEVETQPYLTGPYLRAVLVVNGTRRRVWSAFGTWRYA